MSFNQRDKKEPGNYFIPQPQGYFNIWGLIRYDGSGLVAGLFFVPVFGVAILVWAGLVGFNPDLDRSWWAISLLLPSAFLLASASYSLATEGVREMELLSLPVPFLVGCLALLPRRIDPQLRPGAICHEEPMDAA
ncbi:MAG: hypothetical protein IPK00_25420 [Deltaproteobacteria bacterium]|nr:hypothetical protein [Deltaproteobacteria bacterium]